MAISRKRERSFRQNSAVNVTPLVDVMLVLLIIFMVTAPMMTTGIKVELPRASAAQTSNDKDPLVLAIDAKGELYIQDEKIAKEEVVVRLKAILQNNSTACVYLRGDKNLKYERVMELMSFLIDSGITRVALIAEAQTTKTTSPSPKKSSHPSAPVQKAPASTTM